MTHASVERRGRRDLQRSGTRIGPLLVEEETIERKDRERSGVIDETNYAWSPKIEIGEEGLVGIQERG